MKRIFFLLLLLLAFANPIYSQLSGWKKLLNEATYDVWVNPQNPNTMFVGGEGRVVYRSYDAGNTWDTLILGYKGGGALINNIFIHPIDTNVVICGGLIFGDVRRTTNHGTNKEDWKIVLQGMRNIALNGKALVMKPDDPDILYIGDYTSGTFFRSQDRGATWDSISTIFTTRQKRDSIGGPWRDTLLPVQICSISIREDSTNIVFAGSCFGENFISTDGGYTWTLTDILADPEVQSDCEVTRVDFSKKNPLVGYAVITYLSPINTPNGGLHKTTDGGYTWDLIAFADTSLWTVAVRTNDAGTDDEVYVGGYTEHFYTYDKLMTPGIGMVRRSLDGGLNWQSYDASMDWKIENPSYQYHLNSICTAPDEEYSYLFTVGNHATILRTDNGGESWYPPDATDFDRTDNLNSVYFTSRNNGYAVGDKGFFIKADNKGRNWYLKNSFTNKNLNSIFLIDSINAAVCGDRGSIFISNDACNNWAQKHSSNSYNLKSIVFVNHNIGYAAGESTILKTVDGGNNWSEIYSVNELNINEIHFINADTGFAVGDKSIILKTTNGGNDWNLSSFDDTSHLYSVFFIDSVGYASGHKGIILKSTDYGNTWKYKSTYMTRDLFSIRFKEYQKIYGCGEKNTLFMTVDSAASWYATRYNYGPRANMWSQRIFKGKDGFDKVYTASESGFFMLDLKVDVLDDLNIQELSNLNVYKNSTNSICLNYDRKNPNSKLTFRVVDLSGKMAYNSYINNNSMNVREVLNIPNISKGVYLCQMLEDGYLSNKLIVID